MFDYNVYTRGKFGSIVEKLECHSKDILQHYNEPLSFIFLDGWHSFSTIINEFNLLQHLMTDDCIIGFHDVSPTITKHDPGHIMKYYTIAMSEFDTLMNSKEQDFRLDEAISYICMKYGYRIIDIPVRNDETHFPETHLTEWVRGTTSPLNSFTAIKKMKDYIQ